MIATIEQIRDIINGKWLIEFPAQKELKFENNKFHSEYFKSMDNFAYEIAEDKFDSTIWIKINGSKTFLVCAIERDYILLKKHNNGFLILVKDNRSTP